MQIFGRLSIEKLIQELKQVVDKIPKHYSGGGAVTFAEFDKLPTTAKGGFLVVPGIMDEDKWLVEVAKVHVMQASIISDIQTDEPDHLGGPGFYFRGSEKRSESDP